MLIEEFDFWRQGFDGGSVFIYLANTTNLASVYSDPACTIAEDNPQTLTSEERSGVMGGKFVRSLYTAAAYQAFYGSVDQGGVQVPPISDLDGEDVSLSVVTPTGAISAHTLAYITARTVWATDYGDLGASAATNTATLNAAAGVVAGSGGGRVLVPHGTYPVTTVPTLGLGCIIEGEGRGVTILQCQTANKVCQLSGDRSGLKNLTLDGVNNVAGGIGIYSKAVNEIILSDVEIKNFETGTWHKGGRRMRWRDVFIDACGRGVRWVGDDDAGGGADGDQLSDCQWIGGRVTNCTTTGLELEYEDHPCLGNSLIAVGFEDNTGIALKIRGAQITRFDGCWWEGNFANFDLNDDTSSTPNDDNIIDGLTIANGRMDGGTVTIAGTALNVMFDRIDFSNVDVTLTVPTNPILVRDSAEDALVTIAGTGTKWLRNRSIDTGATFGITTDATVTKSWEIHLDPGQRVGVHGWVIGNQRNGTNSGEYFLAASAKRNAATLAYDAQSANFTVGATLTGATSHCTALIVGDSDSGTTGTLTVRQIVKGSGGEFIDNEIITDGSGGSATANGTLSVPVVALLGSSTSVRTDREDDAAWGAALVANGPALECQVTGKASMTISWTTDLKATVSD